MKSRHASESISHASQDMNLNHRLTLTSCAFKPGPGSEFCGHGCLEESEKPCDGSSDQSGLENVMSCCSRSEVVCDRATVTSEDDSRSSLSSTADDENNVTPEIQQAYRIFQSFLSEKHKATTALFWHPIGSGCQEDQAPDSEMCFKRMDDKFVNREYESITAFVTDFRLMLENCYRFHGVDHWISRQAQKLEVILEQKLTLLSRTLREKTTLAVTSGGRFGTEDEKSPAGMSSRRRSVPRCLAAITVGGSESIMVQALRLEELQRAKEDKRQRELERKEAEEGSAKEVEEWERSLLSLAEPSSVCTMWELPAIGHFLCLAQMTLNLPEIVYYELERCLLMPRCSSFLAKVMTSLLCPLHKRATLHRRPALHYRKWEAELRQKVQGWYLAVSRAEDQVACAEQLGLCHQFFWTIGEINPLEETAFHLLPFNQRVWLLKGLCDHVYKTQRDVQDAVLGQPIHECRESILGYDSQENTYIHFPHFCGADLRIYRQSPCLSMEFPLPLFHVKRAEEEPSLEGSEVKECMKEKGLFPSVDGVMVDSDSVKVCTWGSQEDSLCDRDKLYQKRTYSVHLQCKDDSGSLQEKFTEVEGLKDETEEKWHSQPCFRGRRYKSKMSPQTLEKKRACEECSRTSQKTSQPCSHCQLQNDHIQPDVNRPQTDDSAEGTARTTSAKKKKRKQKKERKHSVRNADRLRLKSRRVKKSLHRAAAKKKQKLRRKFDMKMMSWRRTVQNRSSHLPVEPTFQLVCSSLDDLRALISRTEDELDELNNIRKRSGRWQQKRSTVKELHITLIRLLNELLPWEPKLVKAFQKNRVRLKKECDDFRKHLEYESFNRERMETAFAGEALCRDDSLSTETARELEDDKDKIGRTLKEDTEAPENINQLGNYKLRCLDGRSKVIMACNETGPITRGSKRHHRGTVSKKVSPFKRGKMDPESLSVEPNVDQTATNPQTSERASVLPESVRSFQGTYKPIQALLARSVGNKVTLINHPKAAVMAPRPQEPKTASASCLLTPHSEHTSTVSPTPAAGSAADSSDPVQERKTASASCLLTPHSEHTSTVSPTPAAGFAADSSVPAVYKTAGGLGLLRKGGTSVRFSVQPISDETSGEKVKQQVVILPSSLLIQSTEKAAAQQSPTVPSVSVSNTTTYLLNAPGFTVQKNRVHVQQVAPLKDTSDVRIPSAAVLPSLRTLPTATGGSAMPKKTTDSKAAPNKSASQTSCSSNKPDAKQELRTVCIRDSQSILVTTRGGNTGVVRVQTSEQSGTGNLPPSPVFSLSPQLQAFLVSKSFTSTTQDVSGTLSTGSLPTINPSINRGSSQSPSKAITPVSSSPLVTQTLASSVLNHTCNNSSVFADGSSDKMLITGKSQLLATSKTSDGILLTMKDIHSVQKRTVSKHPRQRAVPGLRALDQSNFQKVFLVTSSINIPSAATKVTTTTATSPVPESRVMFISQPPVSDSSTLAFHKGASALEVDISTASCTSPKLEASSVVANLQTTFGCTVSSAVTKVHSVSSPGSASKMLGTNRNMSPVIISSTKNTPVIVSRELVTSTSSGIQIGKQSNVVARTSESGNSEGLLKAAVSVNDRTLTFSTLGTGHMASSALLSVVKQDSAGSVLNSVNSKPGLVVGSSTADMTCSLSGSVTSKHTNLPVNVMVKNPQKISYCTFPSINTASGSSTAGLSHLPVLSSTVKTGSSSTSTSPVVMNSGMRPNSATKSVQEKIVINTTTPLAPGTQLLINNTRLVVPAQGLGPGSHVLLISSSCPGDLREASASLVPTSPRRLNVSGSCPVPSVVQGLNLVSPQQTLVRLPSPTTVGCPDRVCQQVNVRSSLTASGYSALSRVAQTPFVDVSSTPQGFANIVRLPIFQTSDGKGLIVTSSQGPTETPGVGSLSQGGLLSTTSAMLLPARLNHSPPQNQVSPVKTVISQNPATVTRPPVSSTISRLLNLPVAMVPPIGCPTNSSQATPTTTVPPTVIMTPCQPIRTVQPGTIGKTLVLPQTAQVQSKSAVQMTSGASTSTASKLLLSPDGATLNIVPASEPSSIQVLAKPMTVQVDVPTASRVTLPVLNTNEPMREADVPEGLHH